MKAYNARSAKVGIALAGGGPLGAVYEIGFLLARERALKPDAEERGIGDAR